MIKQSRTKEQSLGKLMKVYVSQMLLNSGIQSCQEQGINLLAEFLIKIIRKVGTESRRLYELQGRQEGDIFHIFLALDHLSITPTVMLTYFKRCEQSDTQLNMLLSGVMEQIFKEKYGGTEQEEIINLKQKPSLQLNQLVVAQYDADQKSGRQLDDLLQQQYYSKDQTLPKDKKSITEKELKEEKRKYIYQFEEDQYERTKKQNKQRQQQHKEYNNVNPFNAPIKRIQAIMTLDL